MPSGERRWLKYGSAESPLSIRFQGFVFKVLSRTDLSYLSYLIYVILLSACHFLAFLSLRPLQNCEDYKITIYSMHQRTVSCNVPCGALRELSFRNGLTSLRAALWLNKKKRKHGFLQCRQLELPELDSGYRHGKEKRR